MLGLYFVNLQWTMIVSLYPLISHSVTITLWTNSFCEEIWWEVFHSSLLFFENRPVCCEMSSGVPFGFVHLSENCNCSAIFCHFANCFTLLSYYLSECILPECKGKLSSWHSLLMYIMAQLQVICCAVRTSDEESAIRICDHVTQLQTKHFQS